MNACVRIGSRTHLQHYRLACRFPIARAQREYYKRCAAAARALVCVLDNPPKGVARDNDTLALAGRLSL